MAINIIEKNLCCGCSACASICPKNCISMEADEEGFLYPKVNASECINCNLCEKVCPFINSEKNEKIPAAYAAMNKDKDIRMKSSSGGVFYLAAEYIIKQGGIVFGAVLSEDCETVYHTYADNLDEVKSMMGSKYVQSKIGDSYTLAKKFLQEGKQVLFTGTPCQIAGLKNFLKKDYDNLFTVDIICHGTPSPKLWRMYVNQVKKKEHIKLKTVNFRAKNPSWENFGMRRIDAKGNETFFYKGEDYFLKLFLRNYCLRPSCYSCVIKKAEQSDITIGDFWGISNVDADMNDDRGTSAILVRTEKGEALFKNIEQNMLIKEVAYSQAVKENKAEYESVAVPEQREEFMHDMNKLSFSKLCNKYINESFKKKVKKLLVAQRIIKQ